ncbi:MAG: DUF4124 domain-containing protein [Halofilum sp. (in: g-proteobacteria)]|nr:DUF4124 domain-containing protein [Halofilum sp. (in: g-proteobacteria)]
MRTLILLLLLLPATAAAEKIYRSTDDEGNPLFTDDPPSDDAEPVKLDPLATVPATETDPDPAARQQQDGQPDSAARPDDAPPYGGIAVTYPPADQAVRHNGGIVPFRVALAPAEAALRPGHEVQILLDGEVRGSGSKLQVSVSPVDRGPHTVRARVVDASGRAIVTSEPVDFVLLRAALGND